jgi:hypothetical protein
LDAVKDSGLEETAENRVESGTQCGYAVLAVECGLPAATLAALAILAGAFGAWRRGAGASSSAER